MPDPKIGLLAELVLALFKNNRAINKAQEQGRKSTYMSCSGSLTQSTLVQSFEVFVLAWELTFPRIMPLRGD